MINKLLFVAACLLLVNCASVNECVSNKQVENEFASVVRTGGWKAKIHIEPIEDGSFIASSEMEKMYPVPSDQIDYIHNAGYFDKDKNDFIITRLVFSSKTFIIRYIRQLISYDAATRTAKWNEKCLEKTRIEK